MPSRPKSVVIDGIHYQAIDVSDARSLQLELLTRHVRRLRDEARHWRERAEAAEDRVIWLHGAIQAHRYYVGFGATENDRNLWGVLQ